MNRPEKWNQMVKCSKEAIEDFNDFLEDKAVVWADNELKNYKRAMLILAGSYSDWALNVSDEDEKFVDTMLRRAEGV